MLSPASPISSGSSNTETTPAFLLVADDVALSGSDYIDIANGITVTNNNVTIDSGQAISGHTSSFYFNGTTAFLKVLANANLHLEDNDYTIEFWKRAQAKAGQKQNIDLRNSGGQTAPTLYRDSAGVEKWAVSSKTLSYGAQPNLVWQHNALCREVDAGMEELTVFLDGVAVKTSSQTVVNHARGDLTIGARYDDAVKLLGHVDFIRIYVGECIYPNGDTFTPPTSY